MGFSSMYNASKKYTIAVSKQSTLANGSRDNENELPTPCNQGAENADRAGCLKQVSASNTRVKSKAVEKVKTRLTNFLLEPATKEIIPPSRGINNINSTIISVSAERLVYFLTKNIDIKSPHVKIFYIFVDICNIC